jgi:hypothetical protein
VSGLPQRCQASGQALREAHYGWGRGHVAFLDHTHKAIAPTAECLNVPLLLSAIPEGLTGLHDPVIQSRFTDEPRWPDVLQEFLAGDDCSYPSYTGVSLSYR